MTHTVTYQTTLLSVDGTNTGVEVAGDVIEKWKVGKRVPVVVNVNGYEYRSTIVPMGGKFLIPFSSDKRAATGIAGGDAITVTLTHDTEERTVEVPDDFAAALAAAGLRETFDSLSYSKRKEYVRSIVEAKTPETRERRLTAALTKISIIRAGSR